MIRHGIRLDGFVTLSTTSIKNVKMGLKGTWASGTIITESKPVFKGDSDVLRGHPLIRGMFSQVGVVSFP